MSDRLAPPPPPRIGARTINFVLPFVEKTGGVAVVLEHARQLGDMGHSVRIYYPLVCPGSLFSHFPRRSRFPIRVLHLFRNLKSLSRPVKWFKAQVDIRAVPMIADIFIRNADAVIATAWPTAYSVSALSASKGRKFYFVQDYEIWDQKSDRVDESYRLSLELIVIAPWLTELMRTKFGREVTAEIHNGVDLDFFAPTASGPAPPISVLMMHHTMSKKGTSIGIQVLKRLHAAHPEIRIRMFGMHPFPDKEPFIEYFQDPSPEFLRGLYQSSHILLSPSLSEGWGLPVVEGMACGCAVVATNVGCVPILKDAENLLCAEPGDADGLFDHLVSLVRSPERLSAVSRKGNETIRRFGWPQRSREFERAIFSDRKP